MKALLSILAAFSSVAASPATMPVPDRFGLRCSGMETVVVGHDPARHLAYHLSITVDLPHRNYCDGLCRPAETYILRRAASGVLMLSDVDLPQQSRHMLFDPRTMHLSDDQRIRMGGLPALHRRAQAQCQYGAAGAPSQDPTP